MSSSLFKLKRCTKEETRRKKLSGSQMSLFKLKRCTKKSEERKTLSVRPGGTDKSEERKEISVTTGVLPGFSGFRTPKDYELDLESVVWEWLPFASKLGSDWFSKAGFSLVPIDPPLHRGGGGEPGGDGEPVLLYIRTARDIIRGQQNVPSNCKSYWYLIPPNHLEIEPQQPNPDIDIYLIDIHHPPSSLSPAFEEMPGDVLLNSVVVALLPRIYVLGGGGYYDRRSTQVFSYDITSPHKGWQRRPNMICGRSQPSAVALDGKIYVFGGFKFFDLYVGDPTLPYAEVYDPESDKWEVLDPAGVTFEPTLFPDPEMLPGHALLMDQYNSKHLLVRSRSTIFTYNISSGSITRGEEMPATSGGSAVVDGILYCCHLSLGCIIAYDLRKDEWFREPVRGLTKGTVLPYSSLDPLFLFHIGNGRLCIVHGCQINGADYTKADVLVHCSVVRVSRIKNAEGATLLVASLESFKRYIVPGNVLQDCLLL